MTRLGLSAVVLALAPLAMSAEPAKPDPRAALKPFNDLVGSWRGTGSPEGTREEKQRGFWIESQSWEWQFKDGDAWLRLAVEKGKHFAGAELRPIPGANRYRLTATTPDKQTLTFEGTLQDRKLTLERTDEATKEVQRLVLSLLHSNRVLYRYEVKPAGGTSFVKKYQVGATKEGESFADSGSAGPECIVSGGLGTMRVSYKGETYYVCCTGCRDEFKENPEKYIKEYEEKKKSGKKEK
jgi:YHS domain